MKYQVYHKLKIWCNGKDQGDAQINAGIYICNQRQDQIDDEMVCLGYKITSIVKNIQKIK